MQAHSVLTVSTDKRTIYCPTADLSSVEAIAFDRIYGGQPPDDQPSHLGVEDEVPLFEGSVAHLVSAALRGTDATLVVAGESRAAKEVTLLGGGSNGGLLAQSAATLFGWLDCGGSGGSSSLNTGAGGSASTSILRGAVTAS